MIIDRSIIGANVTVAEGARIRESVVDHDSSIGSESFLHEVVVGCHSHIGAQNELPAQLRLSCGIRIPAQGCASAERLSPARRSTEAAGRPPRPQPGIFWRIVTTHASTAVSPQLPRRHRSEPSRTRRTACASIARTSRVCVPSPS
ncbi:hypothetical protein E4K10_25030 [Streptomyces sp. T1317-0309]|nr:hypothetical protein E4K10_25030 [Streptomyces sp. T1317-0309]